MTLSSLGLGFLTALVGCGAGVLSLVWAQAPASAAAPQGAVALQPCEVPGVVGGGRCGTYVVYENRTGRNGRQIALNIVVVPALDGTRTSEPVFWLEGGPGGAATQATGPVSQNYLRELRGHRDLVFVDQRGTGKSNPLKCDDIGETPANLDGYFGKLFPRHLIRSCIEKLSKVADLTQYSTGIAMDDLDDVRKALGYDKISLAGASYGTLSAQVYIRQHADHVRAAFLVGVVTPGFRLPLPFARAAQNALDRLFMDCAADRSCRTTFPDLRSEFEAVLARFEKGALVVNMVDPANQQERPVKLERESYVEHLRAMLYSTAGARLVPLIVHRAFEQDFRPFQTMATRFNLGGPSTSRGMYFSVTCSEAIPFISEQDIISDTHGTFVGDQRVRAHMSACADWLHGEVPRSFTDPVTTDVPIVMFSGDADGSTPPWIAQAAAALLPNGRHILAPHTGHQIDGPCTWELMHQFFTFPSAQRLDASCVAKAERPPFAREMP